MDIVVVSTITKGWRSERNSQSVYGSLGLNLQQKYLRVVHYEELTSSLPGKTTHAHMKKEIQS